MNSFLKIIKFLYSAWSSPKEVYKCARGENDNNNKYNMILDDFFPRNLNIIFSIGPRTDALRRILRSEMHNNRQHLDTQARSNPKRKERSYPNSIWNAASP